MNEAQWLPLNDVAQRYSLSDKTIRRLAERGKFPQGRKFGRVIRYRVADLDAFDKTGRVEPTGKN